MKPESKTVGGLCTAVLNKPEKYTLALVSLVASITIIESAYLGLNGSHEFRQADVYGHLLGVLQQRGFEPFDLFSARSPWGEKAVFDFPLYQYAVAMIVWILDKDPLVAVRYFNLAIWVASATSGYVICKRLADKLSALIFVALFSTSAIYLHYHSVPMPDTLAIALSLSALALLFQPNPRARHYISALVLIVLASLIKTPIPFVFVVFYIAMELQRSTFAELLSVSQIKANSMKAAFLVLALIFAVLAEYYRGKWMVEIGSKSGHLWQWYFGSLELRVSSDFWRTVLRRSDQWLPGFLALFLLAHVAVGRLFYSDDNKRLLVAALSAFAAGWLVFSNVYKIHDYYQLPIGILMFFSFASAIASLIRGLKTRYKLSDSFVHYFPLLFSALLLINFTNHRPFGEKVRSDFWRAVEYGLMDESRFLLVSDNTRSPVAGGKASTGFDGISHSEFESNCVGYLEKYNAVLVEKNVSKCLDDVKGSASIFIQSEDKLFYKG